jgi:hypothetical protein
MTATELITVVQTCMLCSNESSITVDRERYEKWVEGRRLRLPSATHSVQAIFSDLSPDQREILISGTHPSCFDAAFGGGKSW